MSSVLLHPFKLDYKNEITVNLVHINIKNKLLNLTDRLHLGTKAHLDITKCNASGKQLNCKNLWESPNDWELMLDSNQIFD